MRTVLLCARVTLSELAQLKNPVADVALVGVVVKLLPFVHVNTGTLISVLAAVGLIASWGKTQLANVPAKIAERKAAKATDAGVEVERVAVEPEPVPAQHFAPEAAPTMVVVSDPAPVPEAVNVTPIVAATPEAPLPPVA